MKNYRLFLFKPTAINLAVDWTSSTYRELLLGELKVDNLKTSIRLQDISTINFDLPESILGELNPRIDETLDNYIVELWYGDITSYSTATIHRFIITKLPLEYDGGVKRYCYQGSSIEHHLEFQQLLNWPGVEVKDFYRTIVYDHANNRFTETAATGFATPTYSISTSGYNPGGENMPIDYITIPTTTAATTPPLPLDIFIYQYRRNSGDTLNSESSLIEYEQNVPSGTLYEDTSGFKPGFYIPVLDANGKVTAIKIALPKDFREFNSASKVFEFFLYDNPASRHFAIGINTDEEIEASDMYLDLAQDKPVKFTITCSAVQNSNIILTKNNTKNRQRLFINQTVTNTTGLIAGTKITALSFINNEIKITLSNNFTASTTRGRAFIFESLNAAEYGAYAFTPQLIYSTNGLKLAHILNGNVENSNITIDGILYNTGFTIGTIDNTIALKYRSNIQLNNISKYEAIKSLAETFDSIAVFNSVNKTVSFYPDKNEEVFTNNGLIITQQNYLKSLTNDIDSSKIITKAYAAGKDNLSISLITPNGNDSWEDYSYFLDSYYVKYPAASGVTIANDDINDIDENTGVKYTTFPSGSLSRWMDSTEALNIAKWQYARDYFHDIMLNDNIPSIAEHVRYQNLYNLRSEAINNFVKEETKYFELKATEYKYKYLNDYYIKENDNAGTNTRQKTFVYKFSSSTTASDPGSTFFRLNNATFASVTEIYIDNLDNSSIDRSTFLSTISVNNNPIIVLADVADVNDGAPTNYIFYQVNGDATNNTGYVTINVTFLHKTQSGTTFTNNNTINLKFNTWEEVYKDKYNDAVAASTVALIDLDGLHYQIYNTRFDGTIAESGDSDYSTLSAIELDSFATKILEVQGFLDKERWTIDLNKLKPFVKEAVMSDSNLDNELDLLTTTQEYLVENSKPIVTLSIDVVDFLASVQASVDWNKVKIGDIVNIYFPDFNIDTTAQLKEISIDFQSNKLNFTISTYRQYSRLPMTYVMRQIRRSYDNQTNKLSYQYDKNVVGSNRANVINKKLTRAGFAAENAPVKLGAKSPDGSTSTEISGEGFVSNVIVPDPILETFTYTSTKTLTISDGNLLGRNVVSGSLTSEIEVSGDNGLVIRKIENGVSSRQVYIDVNGNATFSGTLSAPVGDIGGWTISNNKLNAGSTTTYVELNADAASSYAIFAGNTTGITAPFSVTKEGALKSTSGEIGGFTIGADFLRSGADNTKLLLEHDATNPFMSIGQSTNSYNQPGIFVGFDSADNTTKFSINPLKTRTFNTTSGSTTLTTGDTTDLTPGMLITGSGILAGTYIESITNSTTLEMTGTSNTTASGVNLSFTNSSLTYDGDSLNIGPYNFSALGLSGSGSIRRSTLLRLYDIRLYYDEIYLKDYIADPTADFSESQIKANSIISSYTDIPANPAITPTSRFYTEIKGRGTNSLPTVSFNRQNSGINTNSASLNLVPDSTLSSASGDVTVTIPVDDGTLILNPMTAAGQLIIGVASGEPDQLAAGTSGQLLRSNGTTITWSNNALYEYNETQTNSTTTYATAATFSVTSNRYYKVDLICFYNKASGSVANSSQFSFTGNVTTSTLNGIWEYDNNNTATKKSTSKTFSNSTEDTTNAGFATTSNQSSYTDQFIRFTGLFYSGSSGSPTLNFRFRTSTAGTGQNVVINRLVLTLIEVI